MGESVATASRLPLVGATPVSDIRGRRFGTLDGRVGCHCISPPVGRRNARVGHPRPPIRNIRWANRLPPHLASAGRRSTSSRRIRLSTRVRTNQDLSERSTVPRRITPAQAHSSMRKCCASGGNGRHRRDRAPELRQSRVRREVLDLCPMRPPRRALLQPAMPSARPASRPSGGQPPLPTRLAGPLQPWSSAAALPATPPGVRK